jgi:hypothetical protein
VPLETPFFTKEAVTKETAAEKMAALLSQPLEVPVENEILALSPAFSRPSTH